MIGSTGAHEPQNKGAVIVKKRKSAVLIDTIQNFPAYALHYLRSEDPGELEYNEAKAVDDIRAQFNATHERVSFDQEVSNKEFTNTPAFGLPCEAMPVNVWGVPRDVVLNP
jgi:hypothetical protein